MRSRAAAGCYSGAKLRRLAGRYDELQREGWRQVPTKRQETTARFMHFPNSWAQTNHSRAGLLPEVVATATHWVFFPKVT